MDATRSSKTDRKLDRERTRRMDGWEQYRALWDGIDFKRQVINMNDKKVRFALVIMAALNAVLLIVFSREPTVALLHDGVRRWLVALLGIYGAVTFYFMTSAIEALRPRPEARRDDAIEWQARERGGLEREHGRPVGFFIRGSLQELTFDEERRLWSEARLSDMIAELILFNRSASVVLTRQLQQVAKAYIGLKLLVVIAAVLLVAVGVAGR